jgi:hypothetical protein
LCPERSEYLARSGVRFAFAWSGALVRQQQTGKEFISGYSDAGLLTHTIPAFQHAGRGCGSAAQPICSPTAREPTLEDAIQNARRYYNAVVRDLNTKIQQFPTNIFANMLGFKPREFFEVTAPAKREAPKVSFNAPSAPTA